MCIKSELRTNVVHAAATQQGRQRFGEALIVLIAASVVATSAAAATVTVSNTSQSAITAAISLACNGSVAGTVILPNGTYSVTSAINVPGSCTLQAQTQGQASLNITSGGNGVNVNGNSITITGLVFNGGGIVTTNTSLSTPLSNLTITNNIFQNIS